jgi:ENTS family enterobactin (siderophore) exporter
MLGAFTSGWIGSIARPGLVMLFSVVASAFTVATLGLVGNLILGLLALIMLGYLGSISLLLQFTLVQANTPNHLLGRINALWAAQNVVGDSIGTILLGGMARALTPITAIAIYGGVITLLAVILGGNFSTLRRLTTESLLGGIKKNDT